MAQVSYVKQANDGLCTTYGSTHLEHGLPGAAKHFAQTVRAANDEAASLVLQMSCAVHQLMLSFSLRHGVRRRFPRLTQFHDGARPRRGIS